MLSRGKRCENRRQFSWDSMPIGDDKGFSQQVLKVHRGYVVDMDEREGWEGVGRRNECVG